MTVCVVLRPARGQRLLGDRGGSGSALPLCRFTAQRRFHMAECVVNSVTSGYHPLKQHPHHFS